MGAISQKGAEFLILFFETRGFHVVAPEIATRGDQQLKRFAMAKTL